MVGFVQYTINGLALGAIYTAIAIGIVLVYKSTKVFNFAQPAIVMFGVMISMVTISYFGLVFGILLALILTGALGLIMYRLTLRPLIGQPLLSALLMTLALSEVLQGFATLFWGTLGYGYPSPFSAEPIHMGEVSVSQPELAALVAIMLVIGLVALFYQRSLFGKVMRATAEDHQIAQGMGIGVQRVFTVSWAGAGILAVVVAVFLGSMCGAHTQLSIVGLRAIPAVLVGGLDSIAGAILGGLLIGVLEVWVAGYIGTLEAEVVPYIILLLVLLVKPYGLFGLVRIERV